MSISIYATIIRVTQVHLRMRVMCVLAPRECHAYLAMATREWCTSHERVCVMLPVICTIFINVHESQLFSNPVTFIYADVSLMIFM